MAKHTKIQWTDSTVNPTMGCSGCELWNEKEERCYTGHQHNMRHQHKGYSPDFNKVMLFPGRMAKIVKWSDMTGEARPDKPWLNGLPRLIFIGDMSDIFSTGNILIPEGLSYAS